MEIGTAVGDPQKFHVQRLYPRATPGSGVWGVHTPVGFMPLTRSDPEGSAIRGLRAHGFAGD
jgi:hypothetical protein